MDMQVECSNFQTVEAHHSFLRDSDVLPVLKVFAQAGFILGWSSQGPIVKDARKSVALWLEQKEKENSAPCSHGTSCTFCTFNLCGEKISPCLSCDCFPF